MNNEPEDTRQPKEIPFLFVLLLCGVLAVGTFALAFADGATPPVQGLDFRAFYSAGRIVLGGGNLYDLPHQFAVQKSVWPSLETQSDSLPFFNPPFAALPMALVAWLPPVQAFAVWTVFEAVLLAFLLRVLARELPQSTLR